MKLGFIIMKNSVGILFSCFFLLQQLLYSYESDTDYRYQESYTFGTFNLGIDWLYWETTQTGLNFGNKLTHEYSAYQYVNSRSLKPKFEYASGFKIYGCYTTNDDCLKFSFSYTHMPSQAKKEIDEGLVGIELDSLFISDLFPFSSSLLISKIKSQWSSKVNICDLDVGKRFCFCDDCIEVFPHIGIRFLGISQTFKLKNVFDSALMKTNFKGSIQALGIECGLMGTWNIFEKLSLMAHAGGAVLYASSHNKNDLDTFSSYSSPNEKIKHKKECQFGIPMFDAYIGLVYFDTFWCYNVNFHLGWEEHIIFDTNKFFSHSSGNMNLHGLTLGGEVSF